MSSYITYWNDKTMDGVGAQLQRILGIYALAKHLGINYYHSGIKMTAYQGVEQAMKNEFDHEQLKRWNDLILLKNKEEIEFDETHTIENVNLVHLSVIKDNTSDKKKLYKIFLPFDVLNKYSNIYHTLKNENILDYKRYSKLDKNKINICVHVRRGELYYYAPERLLPNSYYLDIIHKIEKYLQKEYVVNIYSEEVKVNSNDHSRVFKSDSDSLKDFYDLKNVCMKINGDPIETVAEFIDSDILVISKSSFSYIGGLFNNKIVITPNFWNAFRRMVN